jgi:para-nitrobenzyl esterase
MVWLHGGGFANGSGGAAMYDGGALGRKGDVVTVTVNHRLNVSRLSAPGEAFGPEYAQSAWPACWISSRPWNGVRDNIEAFGGNPADVTIFGDERRRLEGEPA